MTLVPFTDCCLLLGVDPKTLRLWLTSARLSCTRHPTDARLKCLTPSQLQRLAELHGRSLPNPLPGDPCGPASSPALTPLASPTPALLERQSGSSPEAPPPEAGLRHQITLLQAQVTTLQQQVTELALALLRERPSPWTQQAPPPTPPPPTLAGVSPAPLPSGASPSRQLAPAANPHASAKADRLAARSRALPLIEYGADGCYVILSPTQGVLPLVPDSPEWFDWLSSLTSFTFQGQHGRFSADRRSRNGHFIPFWGARRSHHGRSCHLYLGATEQVTLARLEEMASMMATRLALS